MYSYNFFRSKWGPVLPHPLKYYVINVTILTKDFNDKLLHYKTLLMYIIFLKSIETKIQKKYYTINFFYSYSHYNHILLYNHTN
jgi:hypothetical protein